MFPGHLLLQHTILWLLIRICLTSLPDHSSAPCFYFHQCLCTSTGSQPNADSEFPSADCQNHSLSAIPVVLNPQLRRLNFSWNALTSFSLRPQLYPSLAFLDLSHNHITSLDFSQCPSLRRLDLSWNNLTILNESALEGMLHLTHLNLAANHFTFFHSAVFAPVPQIIYLDLSNNFLTDFSLVTNGSDTENRQSLLFPSLKWLNIGGNELNGKEFCSGHFALPSLSKLDISGATQVNLSCFLDWERLPNLHDLTAVHSSIDALDLDVLADAVVDGSQSESLLWNLTGNKIRHLEYSASLPEKLMNLRRLTVVLTGNPLPCDCSFYRLYETMDSYLDLILQGHECLHSSTPSDLAALRARCQRTPAFIFPLVVSLLLLFLILGCSIIAMIYYRQRKASNSVFVPLHWKNGSRTLQYAKEESVEDLEDNADACLSDSTSYTNPSPEMDLKMADVRPDSSEDELENIYSTIDELYVNREYIEAAQSQPKLYLVTTL